MDAASELSHMMKALRNCDLTKRNREAFVRELSKRMPDVLPDGAETPFDEALAEVWRRPGGPSTIGGVIKENEYKGFGRTDPMVEALLEFIEWVVSNENLIESLGELGLSIPRGASGAYIRTVGSAPPPDASTLVDLARAVLAGIDGSVSRLFELLLRFANQVVEQGTAYESSEEWNPEVQLLRTWCDENAFRLPEGRRTFDKLKKLTAGPPSERRILVRLQRDEREDDENAAILDVWDYWEVPGAVEPGEEDKSAHRKLGDRKVDLRDVDRLGRLVDENTSLSAGAAQGSVVVEVMLSPDNITHHIENWGSLKGEKLGQLVPMVTRRLPSAVDRERRSVHQQRWRTYFTSTGRAVYEITREDDDGYRRADCLCVAFQCAVTDDKITEILKCAWDAGIPGALWLRHGRDVMFIYNGQEPKNYPTRVLERRRESAMPVLVLDNPFWVPEDKELNWEAVL